ncbi:MAG: roadblock/LC7 domain-containing protein [Methanobacteriota archaeon]|nr:MAG: roadblock/LC7 domain-containing protein [Euryarchaeota archaeon]
MIDELPEGKSLGTMQAPLDWITAHTNRFLGAVSITVPDGRGFILVRKGEPLVHYVQHATMVLKGRAALEYLATLPQIDFELRKYTPEELQLALDLAAGGDVLPLPVQDESPELAREPAVGAEPLPEDAFLVESALVEEEPIEATLLSPADADGPLHRDAMIVVRDILRRPGVEGAVILRDGSDPLPMGGIDAGFLAQIVGERLLWAVESAERLKMGSLVQLIHQYDDGDVIIAPLQDACICIVTSPEAPLGHIRSQIRAIQELG